MSNNVCLITNYNYSSFISECLYGVLNQSTPFDLVIIVDDGSTDNSLNVISQAVSGLSFVKIISKINGGQLSAFNAAVNFISPSDRVFFLDSDDVYPPDYLSLVLATLKIHPSEFVYCADRIFSSTNCPFKSAFVGPIEVDHVPPTSALAQSALCWFGGPTSCISISGELFHQIFPFPFELDWKSRADDIIVYASSILGIDKLYIPSVGIGYRTHQNNVYLNRHIGLEEIKNRQIALHNLFNWYASKFNIPPHPSLKKTLEEFFSLTSAQRKRHAVPDLIKLTYKWYKIRTFSNC